jgi:hypothetical protein
MFAVERGKHLDHGRWSMARAGDALQGSDAAGPHIHPREKNWSIAFVWPSGTSLRWDRVKFRAVKTRAPADMRRTDRSGKVQASLDQMDRHSRCGRMVAEREG